MNRIDRKFEQLKAAGEKALVAFITAGDPDLATTEALAPQLEQAGVDILELGVPFSDPIAEGPIIQAASQRSLQNGTTIAGIFEMVGRLRRSTDMPILLMLYLNSIFGFGSERFFGLCRQNGVDGVIVPDLPLEEYDEIQGIADAHGVYSIRLVAPTSGERIQRIVPDSRGFVYCVSSLGVTGTRSHFDTDFSTLFHQIRQHTDTPLCLGFGVSDAEQVRLLKGYCDGLIVGSAIVRIIGEYGKDCLSPASDFVAGLKQAMLEKSPEQKGS